MKKLITIIALASLVSLNFTTVSAKSLSNENNGKTTYYTTEEEQKKQIEDSIKSIMDEKNKARVPEYSKYDYETTSTMYKTFSQFAEGQPSQGTRFPTGGGICWTPGGGRNYSFNVSLGGDVVGIGLSFGSVSKSVTGYIGYAPNRTNYFKLKVDKDMKIQRVNVYGYPLYGGPRKFLYTIYPKTELSLSVYCEKVK